MADAISQLLDAIVASDRFQVACQRYAHGNGTSAAIAAAALVATLAHDERLIADARAALAKAGNTP